MRNACLMSDPWLRSNRRISWCGAMVLMVGVLASGAWAHVLLGTARYTAGRWLGGCLAVLAVLLPAGWLYITGRARLAFVGGRLLVLLRMGRPISVPLEVVECFFVGQGPGPLPGLRGPAAKNAQRGHACG